MSTSGPEIPPPRAGAHVGGVVVGIVGGLVVGFFVAFLSFALSMSAFSGGRGHCTESVVTGILELIGMAAILAAAWYVLYRLSGGSFWLGLARGLLGTVAVFMLIPWPCSLGWAGVVSFLACRG